MPLSSHVTGGQRPAARYGKSQPKKAARSIRANRPSPSARYGLQTQRPDPHPTSQKRQRVRTSGIKLLLSDGDGLLEPPRSARGLRRLDDQPDPEGQPDDRPVKIGETRPCRTNRSLLSRRRGCRLLSGPGWSSPARVCCRGSDRPGRCALGAAGQAGHRRPALRRQHPVAQIAELVGVSHATVYRHLGPAR
jgi:hypothetical protein